MQKYIIKRIGESLMEPADLLTKDDCEITANELLENITGNSISEEDSGDIKRYLNT